MPGIVRTVGLIVITVLVTVFFIQNLASTEVAFLTWSLSAPRAVVFALIFALGCLAGWLAFALRPRRKPDVHVEPRPVISAEPPLAPPRAPSDEA